MDLKESYWSHKPLVEPEKSNLNYLFDLFIKMSKDQTYDNNKII